MENLLTIAQAKKIATPRKPIWVTYSRLLLSGANETYYGIYRAPLYAFGKNPYINMNHPKVKKVATVFVDGDQEFDHVTETRKHATAEFPAFAW